MSSSMLLICDVVRRIGADAVRVWNEVGAVSDSYADVRKLDDMGILGEIIRTLRFIERSSSHPSIRVFVMLSHSSNNRFSTLVIFPDP